MRLIISAAFVYAVANLCAAEVPIFPRWTAYRQKLLQMAANSTLQAAFQGHLQKYHYGTRNQAVHMEFPCFEPINTPPATSVHRLTPADVGVVAAMGDSLTAGTGVKARTIIGLLTEWRGLSWSGGGDQDVEHAPTLPNFIKKFNPNVRGFSLKTGSYESKNAHLNVADPGGKAEDMPFQAELLVERLRTEPGVNFTHDWKVITIFIGGNDLCDYCEDRGKYSAANYLKYVQTALDTLHANVPRAFVNLVQVLTVPMVEELNKGLICDALHLFTCRCGAFPKDDAARQEILDAGVAYRTEVEKLVLSGRYDDRDDFVVVLQPFMEETHPPKDPDDPSEPDLSYFAPDCFHFSAKGQAAAAEGLWNNMLEPVGQKRKSWTPDEPVLCPDNAFPFFATRDNIMAGRPRSKAAAQSDPSLSANFKRGGGGQKTPDQSQGGKVSTTAVVLGCALAVMMGGVALGVALSIRRRRLRRDPESLGILLHNVNSMVYT